MSNPRIVNLANVLCDYCLELKPGDKLAIRASTLAAELVEAVYARAIERGAYPHALLQQPGLDEVYFQYASEEQLRYVSPIDQLVTATFDALLNIRSEANTRALSGVAPARQAIRQGAMREISKLYMERAASGALKWNICQFPTQSYAQDADMGLRDYADFVFGACLTDDPDPVARWQAVAARQQRLVDWLKGKSRIEVEGPHCRLSLNIAGRTFINDEGRRNMPGGEIFTSPVEDSVEGWIRYTFPAIFGGREVEGIELTFAGGRVVKATARKNEEFLLSMLATDEGASRLGEFAIGTNKGITRYTRNILFDEKIGGTIHLAVGNGFPNAGGKNVSAVHWDMVCDMRAGGRITVDGTPFYDSGDFLV